MRDQHATSKRPPLRRRTGSQASDTVPLARAERLLTVREVARLLHVSHTTIHAMIRGGDLPGIWVRTRMRLRSGDVARYMLLHPVRVRRKQLRAAAHNGM